MTDITIAGIADLHLASTVSLCTPTVNLDDGGTYHASAAQLYLYRCWNSYLDQIEKRRCGDVIGVSNGDLGEGDYKQRSTQVITRNKSTITSLAANILDPLVKLSTGGFFVIRGTGAHVGPSAELEEEIAQDIGAIACPETNTASWWVLPLTIEGVRLLIYHHPGTNGAGRPMNKFSGIDRLASDIVFTYANDLRQEPPDIVMCAHIHEFRSSYDHFRTEAITLPCFSFKTEYIYRIGKAAANNRIGGVLIHCNAGEYEIEPILYQPKQEPFYSIGMLKKYDPNNG